MQMAFSLSLCEAKCYNRVKMKTITRVFPCVLLAFALCGCASTVRKGHVFEHTAIDVADPVATANWWVENLGFEITSQRDDVTHTTFIVDRTGCIALELYRAKDAPEAPDYHAMRPLQLHFGFLSDDVDADIERLTAAGATLVVHEKSPGFDGAMMKDPSGISIQFVKRGKPVLKGCRK